MTPELLETGAECVASNSLGRNSTTIFLELGKGLILRRGGRGREPVLFPAQLSTPVTAQQTPAEAPGPASPPPAPLSEPTAPPQVSGPGILLLPWPSPGSPAGRGEWGAVFRQPWVGGLRAVVGTGPQGPGVTRSVSVGQRRSCQSQKARVWPLWL